LINQLGPYAKSRKSHATKFPPPPLPPCAVLAAQVSYFGNFFSIRPAERTLPPQTDMFAFKTNDTEAPELDVSEPSSPSFFAAQRSRPSCEQGLRRVDQGSNFSPLLRNPVPQPRPVFEHFLSDVSFSVPEARIT